MQKLALYRPITHVCHLSVSALQRLCFLVFLSTIPTFLEFHCGPVPRAREETFLVTISLSLPSLENVTFVDFSRHNYIAPVRTWLSQFVLVRAVNRHNCWRKQQEVARWVVDGRRYSNATIPLPIHSYEKIFLDDLFKSFCSEYSTWHNSLGIMLE